MTNFIVHGKISFRLKKQMITHLRLSELVDEIEETLQQRFAGETFWITAEITDVKKQSDKRWCFLKFIEKEGNFITAEM